MNLLFLIFHNKYYLIQSFIMCYSNYPKALRAHSSILTKLSQNSFHTQLTGINTGENRHQKDRRLHIFGTNPKIKIHK